MKYPNKKVERKNKVRAHLLTKYFNMTDALKSYIRKGYYT